MQRLRHTLVEFIEQLEIVRASHTCAACCTAGTTPSHRAALVSPLLRFGRRTACVIMEAASCCCSSSLARARRCAMGPRNGLPGPRPVLSCRSANPLQVELRGPQYKILLQVSPAPAPAAAPLGPHRAQRDVNFELLRR